MRAPGRTATAPQANRDANGKTPRPPDLDLVRIAHHASTPPARSKTGCASHSPHAHSRSDTSLEPLSHPRRNDQATARSTRKDNPSRRAREFPVTVPRLFGSCVQRLFDIGNDVVDFLNPNRDAHESID